MASGIRRPPTAPIFMPGAFPCHHQPWRVGRKGARTHAFVRAKKLRKGLPAPPVCELPSWQQGAAPLGVSKTYPHMHRVRFLRQGTLCGLYLGRVGQVARAHKKARPHKVGGGGRGVGRASSSLPPPSAIYHRRSLWVVC